MNPPTDAREQARHQIAVMQAWVDGKEIEVKSKGYQNGWINAEGPCWDWKTYDYRVKPEERKPREITLIVQDGPISNNPELYIAEHHEGSPLKLTHGFKLARFVEVLPETETE